MANGTDDTEAARRKDIGLHRKSLRARRGLSQDDLAERAGLSVPTLIAAEKGEGRILVDSLQRIADALGVSLADYVEPAATVPAAQPAEASR